jgi:hypothetical protein
VPTTQRRCAESSADREVHQVINPTPSAKGSFPENRHLRIVFKEDRESECGADRARKIGARKAWPQIGRLNSNACPRVKRTWCTNSDPNETCDGGGVFTRGVLACEVKCANAGGNHCGGTIRNWGWRCSSTESCSVCAHECGTYLCAAKI